MADLDDDLVARFVAGIFVLMERTYGAAGCL